MIVGQYVKPAGSAEELYYFGNDNLGSRRVVWNSDGSLKVKFNYSAWGEKTRLGGVAADDRFASFTEKEYDDTGLIYFNARYYDPKIGRFLTEDPSRKGTAWYNYCGNNPLSMVDPTGRREIEEASLAEHRENQRGSRSSWLEFMKKTLKIQIPTLFTGDRQIPLERKELYKTWQRNIPAPGYMNPEEMVKFLTKKSMTQEEINYYIVAGTFFILPLIAPKVLLKDPIKKKFIPIHLLSSVVFMTANYLIADLYVGMPLLEALKEAWKRIERWGEKFSVPTTSKDVRDGSQTEMLKD